MKQRPPRKMTQAQREQAALKNHLAIVGAVNGRDLPPCHDFINRLVSMKAEAGRLGLFQTMHALDGAVQQAGWELAEKLDPNQGKVRDRYLRARNRPKA